MNNGSFYLKKLKEQPNIDNNEKTREKWLENIRTKLSHLSLSGG